MAHFLVEYRELGAAELREAKRGEHIAYRKGFGAAMPLTGPLLDEDERPVGRQRWLTLMSRRGCWSWSPCGVIALLP